jgi:hypothetical protein
MSNTELLGLLSTIEATPLSAELAGRLGAAIDEIDILTEQIGRIHLERVANG